MSHIMTRIILVWSRFLIEIEELIGSLSVSIDRKETVERIRLVKPAAWFSL